MIEKPAVVIIHYHLRPGGVTRVIERAVESLKDRAEILIISGEAPSPDAPLAPLAETFEPLGYSSGTIPDPEQTAGELRRIAFQRLQREPDVWHIHNHSLGKNSFTPQFVRHLANAGCRMLLQPHDFAEDGRPDNYRLLRDHLGESLNTTLYPQADHVWYAPINYRDKSFLSGIGLPHVHAIPNTVTPHPSCTAGGPPAHVRTVVYPARAIRRKNMGEFLLWSLLAPEGYRFQSTLAPQNPAWQEIYNDWVSFAKELNLPVEFDAGRKHDFSELVQNASALISTSIAEGFGLAFLEPWLEGKMLIGRKLPEITTDFEAEGIDLSPLYETLPIPLEWIGAPEFSAALEQAMKQSYAAYAQEWNPEFIDHALNDLIRDKKIDFGILDEMLQRKVIRHLAEHPEDAEQLPAFTIPENDQLIRKNRDLVMQRYGIDAYGNRLFGLYEALIKTPVGHVEAADADALLNTFLQPHRFNLLRA